jgi:hypothetical protein
MAVRINSSRILKLLGRILLHSVLIGSVFARTWLPLPANHIVPSAPFGDRGLP